MDAAILPRDTTDARLVELWLHGRPPRTAREYAREARDFLCWAQKPLRAVTLPDVQGYADLRAAAGKSPATQARTVNALRSLFRFAHTTGYLAFNVALPLRPPRVRGVLAERILDEGSVARMLALEAGRREHALLRLAYASGGRVSELCGLRWRDVVARPEGGQVTLYGKGGVTRSVWLPAGPWREIEALGGGAPDAPVFATRTGRAIHPSQAWRIVRRAAFRAGLGPAVGPGVSAHWLRHAHASHALDRGAPLSLVKETLGHRSIETTGKYVHARPGDSSARYVPA